ncbi:MAG: InlB B-repeat-containing protein, partial [Oscillospiraceae bacterium]|nr:InlB B-repeat-containing protein [Oscillospiraceae bacterium]
MRHRINKALCVFLALVLAVSLLPVTALAEEETYDLWLGETQVTSTNNSDILGDGNASYNPESHTLTLQASPTITTLHKKALIFAGSDLVIKADTGLTLSHDTAKYGVYVENGSLTVNGDANITVPDGYALYANTTLTVNGDVTAEGTYGLFSSNGKVITTGDVKVTSRYYPVSGYTGVEIGGDVEATATDSGWAAIRSGNGSVTIGGSVKAKANETYGVYSNYTLTIGGDAEVAEGCTYGLFSSNGKVIITGDVKVTSQYYSVSGYTGVEISGDVEATATDSGWAAIRSGNGSVTIGGSVKAKADGTVIFAGDTVKIQSGRWELDGTTYAIRSGNGIIIPSTHGIITPEGGGVATITEESEYFTSTYYIITDHTGVPAADAVIDEGVTTYFLWVGGTRVTSGNASDIFEDGKASYDPATQTLTLNGYTAGGAENSKKAQIYANGIDLTIAGTATLTASGADYGIYIKDGSLIITDAAADITATGARDGIYADGAITVSGGTVTATGASDAGIRAGGDITINKSTVKADTTGGAYAIVSTGGNISITGALIITEPEDGEIGTVGSVTCVTDGTSAVQHAVIMPSEDTCTVKFDTDGGTEIADQTVAKGGHIEVPDDPVKDGYAFRGWFLDGEAYDLSIPVTGDITLKAKWVSAYPLWVGGVPVADDNKDDILHDGQATYDTETSTLTLNSGTLTVSGYYRDAVIYADGIDLNVVSASDSLTISDENAKSAIYVNHSNSDENGGNLMVTATDGVKIVSGSGNAIFARNLTITGKTVDVETTSATTGSTTIVNNGNLMITAPNGAKVWNGNQWAISTGGAITITAENGKAEFRGYLSAGKNLTVTAKNDITMVEGYFSASGDILVKT